MMEKDRIYTKAQKIEREDATQHFRIEKANKAIKMFFFLKLIIF